MEQPISSAAVGGNDADSHAQSDVNKLGRFLKKGEEILETFKTSIRSFEGESYKIKDLATAVMQIKHDMKSGPKSAEKRRHDDDGDGQNLSKKSKTRVDSQSAGPSSAAGSSVVDVTDDDIDSMMRSPEIESTGTVVSDQFMSDLDEFFVQEDDCAEPIQEQVSAVVNKSLRPSAVDPEKMKMMATKYKRPKNVNGLQIPRVDGFLWNQLQNNTKTSDCTKQKMIGHLNRAAGPLVKAMSHVYANADPDINTLKECIGDSFKIICASISTINGQRRDAIKKELDPKFKSICTENPITATGLFGDNLTDQTKQLDTTKNIKMTSKDARKDFLEKRRGASFNYNSPPQDKTPQRFNSTPGFNRYRQTGFNQNQQNKSVFPRSGSSGKPYTQRKHFANQQRK